MPNTSEQNRVEIRRFPIWSLVAYAVVVSIAVDAALLLSVMENLSWVYSTIWALSAALVSAAILFSVLEFGISREKRS